jgi:hypothetical protein
MNSNSRELHLTYIKPLPTRVTVIPHSAAKLLLCQQFQCGVGDLLSLGARKKQIPRAKNARGMTVSAWDSGSGR